MTKISKNCRIRVWKKYNKHCAYCGKEIDYANMQVDHLIPICRGGKTNFVNSMPSCHRCNQYKGALTLEEYRGMLLTLHERIMKIYINRVGVDYNIIQINKWDRNFYFEYLERTLL